MITFFVATTFGAAPALVGTELVVNGGFEGKVEPWGWQSTANADGALDPAVRHSGAQSYRLSNRSGQKPNIYARVFQRVPVLLPFSTYRISGFFKGQAVGNATIGGGPGWALRQPIPRGTFNWKQVSVDYETGPDPSDFELMVLCDSAAKALWIDDVRMTLVKTDTEKLEKLNRERADRINAYRARIAAIERAAGADRVVAYDAYIRAGVTIARRFLARIAENTQSLSWSILRLDEIGQVLDETERLLQQRLADKTTTYARPVLTSRPVLKDGAFFVGDRPVFLYGYGHFDQPFKEMPLWNDIGVSLIQDGRVGTLRDERGRIAER